MKFVRYQEQWNWIGSAYRSCSDPLGCSSPMNNLDIQGPHVLQKSNRLMSMKVSAISSIPGHWRSRIGVCFCVQSVFAVEHTCISHPKFIIERNTICMFLGRESLVSVLIPLEGSGLRSLMRSRSSRNAIMHRCSILRRQNLRFWHCRCHVRAL